MDLRQLLGICSSPSIKLQAFQELQVGSLEKEPQLPDLSQVQGPGLWQPEGQYQQGDMARVEKDFPNFSSFKSQVTPAVPSRTDFCSLASKILPQIPSHSLTPLFVLRPPSCLPQLENLVLLWRGIQPCPSPTLWLQGSRFGFQRSSSSM